jgi:hypothetical protein
MSLSGSKVLLESPKAAAMIVYEDVNIPKDVFQVCYGSSLNALNVPWSWATRRAIYGFQDTLCNRVVIMKCVGTAWLNSKATSALMTALRLYSNG